MEWGGNEAEKIEKKNLYTFSSKSWSYMAI